jgi:hypothetical protein
VSKNKHQAISQGIISSRLKAQRRRPHPLSFQLSASSFRLPSASLLLSIGLLAALLTSGCAGHRAASLSPERMSASVDALRHELAALGPGTDQSEAGMVAETAVTYSSRLAEEYRVVTPARLHNLLIQVGIKDRGLCYHWTEDLMKRLQALNLRTYRLHWGVAHKGNDLREHNSVVITANGQPFEAGLLLDPWRNSGDLYWAVVDTDSYPWQELPESEW